MPTPLNEVGLDDWIRRQAKRGESALLFWSSLLSVLPQGVEDDDPRVLRLLHKHGVQPESKPSGLKRAPAQPCERRRLADPDPPPDYMTRALSPLEMEMLQAAEAGTLKRSGWTVTIDGRRRSVVTLKKLQDRRLVRQVALTEDGWEVLTFWRSQTAATMRRYR